MPTSYQSRTPEDAPGNSGRFGMVPSCAYDDVRITDALLAVLGLLATYGDKHGWCFPRQTEMAERRGVSRQAISKALVSLHAFGYVAVTAQERQDKGRDRNLYRVLFDVVLPSAFDRTKGAKSPGGVAGGPQPQKLRGPQRNGVAAPATPEVAGAATPEVASKRTDQVTDQENRPSNRPSRAATPPKPTDDPLVRCAHSLAKLAFEQPEKPLVRSGGDPFSAVLGLFKQALRTGRPVGELEAAVTGGFVEVWTLNGLSTALAKSRKGHRNGSNGHDDELRRLYGGAR